MQNTNVHEIKVNKLNKTILHKEKLQLKIFRENRFKVNDLSLYIKKLENKKKKPKN